MSISDKIEYYEIIKDLLETDVVQEMDLYIQHGTTTCLEHCLMVSYTSYKFAKNKKLNHIAMARAGLLHDLFLYDWHTAPKSETFFGMHGYTHPTTALENAQKYFELSKLEEDIILKHMWPLTLRQIPKYKESILVSLIDKYTSTKETINPYIKKIKKR